VGWTRGSTVWQAWHPFAVVRIASFWRKAKRQSGSLRDPPPGWSECSRTGTVTGTHQEMGSYGALRFIPHLCLVGQPVAWGLPYKGRVMLGKMRIIPGNAPQRLSASPGFHKLLSWDRLPPSPVPRPGPRSFYLDRGHFFACWFLRGGRTKTKLVAQRISCTGLPNSLSKGARDGR